MVDMFEVLMRQSREAEALEDGLVEECLRRFGLPIPKMNRYDYVRLIRGLPDNVFLFDADVRGFLGWIIPQMTPAMLESLRADSDGFQDHYADIYLRQKYPDLD